MADRGIRLGEMFQHHPDVNQVVEIGLEGIGDDVGLPDVDTNSAAGLGQWLDESDVEVGGDHDGVVGGLTGKPLDERTPAGPHLQDGGGAGRPAPFQQGPAAFIPQRFNTGEPGSLVFPCLIEGIP